jgi:hypothetical protein
MTHDALAERTPDALKSEPATTYVPFADHSLYTMLMQYMPASEANGRCAIQGFCPADRAPFVAIWKLQGWSGLGAEGQSSKSSAVG